VVVKFAIPIVLDSLPSHRVSQLIPLHLTQTGPNLLAWVFRKDDSGSLSSLKKDNAAVM